MCNFNGSFISKWFIKVPNKNHPKTATERLGPFNDDVFCVYYIEQSGIVHRIDQLYF